MARMLGWGCLAGLLVLASGCASTKTSNTARTAQEQLLISNSIDQALNKVDFSAFQGSKVFIDEKFLECVDKPYVVGSVRHRVLRTGASMVENADDADIIMEVRSGGVGTTTSDMFVGSPQLSVPGPFPIALPEVRLMSKQSQIGIAKIGIVAYNAKTRQMIGDGGVTLAKSEDKNWYVLGIGPYRNGSIREEMSNGLKTPPAANEPLPYNVAFDNPPQRDAENAGTSRVQWAGSTDEQPTPPAPPIQPASNAMFPEGPN